MTKPLPDDIYPTMQQRFREIGFDRLLFASDWYEIDPQPYIAMPKKQLHLSNDEWEQLLRNEAPYFH